ncbi:MAG: phospholipid carrier-dependent glycosyltransferase, partial [Acidobacteriota bacterium]
MVAATASATAPLALGLSRVVIMDTMMSFFVALALIAFFIAIEKQKGAEEGTAGGRTSMFWTLVAWAAMGLGVLTKGPVAIAVPLFVATVYGIRRRSLPTVWHPFGVMTMLIIVLPWVWAVSRQIPDFVRYVVVTETWARMTTDELRRTEPFWFFVPVLLFGAFPWSFLVLSNLRANLIPDDPDDRWIRLYLWLWIVLPLVFFSLSRGKQEQYVLPLIPAVALLVASRWSDRHGGIRVAGLAWAILGLVALWYAALGMPGLDTSRVSAAVASRTVIVIGVVALAGACVAGFGFVARRSLALIGLAFPLVMFPVASSDLMKEVAASRSTRGLAAAIGDHLTPLTQLLWIESYAPGLSFYLQRTIPLASDDGEELRSNYILRNAELFLDDAGPLRPLRSAEQAVAERTKSWIFLLETQNKDLANVVERSGVPRLTATRKWTA